MKNETQFIQAILNNDDRVFGQFYDFYFEKMKAMLLQMGAQKTEVIDFFHEGIIKFISHVKRGKKVENPGGYLRIIIRNLYTKTKGKMNEHPTEEFNAQIHDQIEEESFADINRVAFVEGITELEKKDMKIVLFRFFCDMNFDKIAQNMGLSSRGSANVTFKRAMDKLRHILTQKNIL